MTDAPGLAAGPEEAEQAGRDAYELVTELYPICRSITGDGVRRTLDLVGKRVPLERHEVASGTPVFDWTVPREWNVTDAWVAGPDGRRVIDLARVEPPPGQLLHPGPGPHDAGGAQAAPAHTARVPGLGPLPDLVLPRDLGVLPLRARLPRPGRRRVRGLRRHAR